MYAIDSCWVFLFFFCLGALIGKVIFFVIIITHVHVVQAISQSLSSHCTWQKLHTYPCNSYKNYMYNPEQNFYKILQDIISSWLHFESIWKGFLLNYSWTFAYIQGLRTSNQYVELSVSIYITSLEPFSLIHK